MSNYETIDGISVPIKAWIKGVPLEDKARQQLMNTSSLPFIFKYLAVMPDVHFGMGATVGSVVPTRGALVPSCVGVDIGCFVGETRIPLLDGTQKSLVELASATEPFWVYSTDQNGLVVPGRAICIQTRADAELMRVTVSGGDDVVCTPDHKFRLSDGNYKEAQALQFNDSLLPLYRRWQTRDGYETAGSGQRRSNQTHILVWEALNGPVPHGHVVHHVNHIHFDNRPENLKLMTAEAHSAYHRAAGRRFDNANPDFQRLRREGISRRVADPVAHAKMVDIGTKNIETFMRERPGEFLSAVAGNGKRGASYLADFNRSPRGCDRCGHVAANPSALLWHKRREHDLVDGRTHSNHKVISTNALERRAEVYCLQVEEHHNFALSAGVFVHNCGMSAARLSLTANDLPDNLAAVRSAIEASVPHGRTNDGKPGDRGAWGEAPSDVAAAWANLLPGWKSIIDDAPKLERGSTVTQLGTLGTGNHMYEVCLDKQDRVWILLHSGSRGVGNRIGSYFIERAKLHLGDRLGTLPDRDLAWLDEGTEDFDDYVRALGWAQRYARVNRRVMMDRGVQAATKIIGKSWTIEETIDCHHNYAVQEQHYGEKIWVTRKGAVHAGEGVMGLIPGSMGTRSYVVRGKGNPESFCSCSHGAGRTMSRGEAKRRITLEDHAKATAGIECRKDADVLDESPAAYKKIEDVMAAQSDLVEIVHELHAVVCVKG